MFGWFKRSDPLVRGLYAFHDGTQKRLVDPLVIEVALEKAGGKDWGSHLSALHAITEGPAVQSESFARVVSEQTTAAVRELIRITRAAFGIPDVDNRGKGLAGAEVLHVLAGYLAFLAALKERFGPLVNSPARPAKSPQEPDTGEWAAVTSSATSDGGNG